MHQPISTFLGIAAAVVLVSGGTAVGGDIVDFEDVASDGNPIVAEVISNGFRFTSEHFHTIDSPELFDGADNGSAVYIGHEGGLHAQ